MSVISMGCVFLPYEAALALLYGRTMKRLPERALSLKGTNITKGLTIELVNFGGCGAFLAEGNLFGMGGSFLGFF